MVFSPDKLARDTEGSNSNAYWRGVEETYHEYPTIKHRARFVINSLKRYVPSKDFTVFDYGVGEGNLLLKIKDKFELPDSTLGGCDISEVAIELTRKKVNSPYLYATECPKPGKKFDVMVCSEVIEHTSHYLDVLKWIFNNLANNGLLVLTTQSGKIHKSDKYAGHVQHFNTKELRHLLEDLGFEIKYARLWGFPFFTLQKFLTDYNFESVKNNYLEGKLDFRRQIVFNIAYLIYFIHDFIDAGPQIFIVASKRGI